MATASEAALYAVIGPQTWVYALADYIDVKVAGAPQASFNVSFLAWMASLPTTLPASPGVAWNNSGTPSVS